jgi:hypothetical protein
LDRFRQRASEKAIEIAEGPSPVRFFMILISSVWLDFEFTECILAQEIVDITTNPSIASGVTKDDIDQDNNAQVV